MNNSKKPSITIIGAGLAGCFMAILLAKRGYTVDIYERSAKKEIVDVASKRSFNLTFYGFGVQMLKEVGLWNTIEPNLLTLDGSMTQVTKNSKPIFAHVDREEMPYYTISRALLVKTFLELVDQQPLVTVHFEHNLLSVNRQEKSILLQNAKSKRTSTVTCDVIIGADGVNSITRSFMQQGQEITHSQEYATWSYKQIAIPSEYVEKLELRSNVAYTWSRKNAVIASFPNKDGSLAAMLILPKDKNGFAALTSTAEIEQLFKESFPALLPAMPIIIESLLHNPEGYFVTVHTDPWYYRDFMVILGDAAHGFFPFFGQGISAAFGDCLELVRLIDTYGEDWGKIFPLFQDARKKHMDALGELSKEGFIRYRRNKRADFASIYERLEFIAHKILPKFIHPPLFMPVSIDPNHTADHLKKHLNQRRNAEYIGMSAIVNVLTGIIAAQEALMNVYKKVASARKK